LEASRFFSRPSNGETTPNKSRLSFSSILRSPSRPSDIPPDIFLSAPRGLDSADSASRLLRSLSLTHGSAGGAYGTAPGGGGAFALGGGGAAFAPAAAACLAIQAALASASAAEG
jgi:hypothetical protein